MSDITGTLTMTLNFSRLAGLWRLRGLTKLSVLLVAIVVLMSMAGFLSMATGWQVTPFDAIAMNLGHRLEAPSLTHVMGTDDLGRDVLSRVIVGAHLSLQVAVLVLVFASTFGMTIGLVAGFFGGVIDECLMRLTDMFLAFPFLILAAAISTTFGGNITTTTVALATVFWPWYARIARARVVALRQLEFVLAARALGARPLYLMFTTLLPMIWPAMIVQATLDGGFVMLAAAGLSFLGLGAQPPEPEWGAMIFSSLSYQPASWWLAAFPGACLACSALGFNLLGDALRDYLDPGFASRGD
jgi:peptide/nickel transport system permease protein